VTSPICEKPRRNVGGMHSVNKTEQHATQKSEILLPILHRHIATSILFQTHITVCKHSLYVSLPCYTATT